MTRSATIFVLSLSLLTLSGAAMAVPEYQQMLEFPAFTEVVISWMTGPLGTGIALVGLVTGLLTAFTQQSVIPAVLGIVMATSITQMPKVMAEFGVDTLLPRTERANAQAAPTIVEVPTDTGASGWSSGGF